MILNHGLEHIFFSIRKKRPKMTWRVLFMAFLCGLFGGTLFQNLYFEGLALMSAMFMVAIINLVPVITFVMAIFFGFEKLNLRGAAGKAKVLGTATGIGGAMLLTFYKGVEIDIWSSHVNLLDPHQNQNWHMAPVHADFGSKLLGVLCAIASSCCFSLWLIIQAKMNEEYPSQHSSTALMSIMGAIQAIVFALCVDRDRRKWKLSCNIRFLAVAYGGIVTSGLAIIVIAWCIRMRGPLFASIFNPLQLVVGAVAASLMLGEHLYLGSVLGAVLIVCGLYMVLLGRSKEMQKTTQLVPLEITRESQADEVAVVVSTPVDHDICDHSKHSQTNTTGNDANDHDYLSKKAWEEHDIHNKGKEEVSS